MLDDQETGTELFGGGPVLKTYLSDLIKRIISQPFYQTIVANSDETIATALLHTAPIA
jgi:hypothetical protein